MNRGVTVIFLKEIRMKVELGSQNINQSLEKDTLNYNHYDRYGKKETQKAGSINGAGFMLDIGGNGAETAAYGMMGSELKSAEELMAEVGNKNVALTKDMMTVMSNTMSKEDYAEFAKNGYSMSDMSVDEQVTSLDKLKAKLAQAGTIIEGYNDDLSNEQLTEIVGSTGLANKIEDALKRNDLPVNEENTKNIVSAMDKAADIKPLNDETIKYMVLHQLEPSVDNLYKAEFSAGGGSQRQSRGYYQDGGGYFQKKADTIEWDQIKEQAEKIVKDAGFQADQETMDNAQWLIEQGIPLTADSIGSLNELRGLELPMSEDDMLQSMAIGIADGKAPAKASLIATETMAEKAASLIEDVDAVGDSAIQAVIENGDTLNLKNLREAGSLEPPAVTEQDAFISARRQLEETRLAMTFEANLKLMKQGINIDTVPLSELVDKLKEAEREYYDPLLIKKGEAFENDAAKNTALDTRIGLYKQTATVFEALRTIPAETIARVDTKGADFTARRVYEVSEPIRAQYQANAGSQGDARRNQINSYEALMTAPRSDMGDSIRKAFRNVDDILADNGYELNESNRKAVRILGYAEMAINPESIDRVREAEQALRQVVEQMTPAKTLEMIRNGDNPLDENIFALNERLRVSTPSQDTEKYSKFLVRLERKGEISEDEKDAFIGMYRLFRQIEKSDGKLLGNVIDAGENLTLRNLLSASRSNRAKGMDYGIDDDFGGLEKLITKGTSISEQIDTGFRNASAGNLDYLLQQSREILDKFGPESLSFDEVNEDSTLDDIYDTVQDRFVNRSVQTLIDDYEDDQAELLAARRVEDNVIEVLSNNNVIMTPDNLLAQDALMNQRGKTFNALMKEAAGSDERSERVRNAVRNLQEKFDSREAATEAYEELKDAADDLISLRADNLTDALDVRELGLLHKQIGLAAQNARNESFEVPVEIDGQWTSVNLKLVKDGTESGTVTATMETERYGKVAAKFTLNRKQLNGYITGDDQEGLKKLAEKADELNKKLSENGREVRQLNFIDTNALDLNRFGAEASEEGFREADNRELYEIAKGFIAVIQESY